MFECSNCTLRAIRAISREIPRQLRITSRPLVLTPHLKQQRRTAVAISKAQIDKDDAAVPFDEATVNLGISPVPKRHLELELRWLNDKVKFANHVRDMLYKKNEFDKALALVRLASKDVEHRQCVVAWNHLLAYTLERGEQDKAWSLYNDMKKRAQAPDSHTYITMFKGLGSSDKSKPPSAKSLARVLSIYNAMHAPNSKVKPTVIHANAALHTCSLGADMSSLWSILSRLEDEGPNAANGITYTVVLNAIRITALKDVHSDADLDELRGLKVKAVQQGRELWTDVVKKWKNGQIKMDSQLIIAMAQLLLSSPYLKDWDDVLSLVQQTTDVDRLVEPVGSKGRQTEHVPQQHDAFVDTDAPSRQSSQSNAASEVFRPVRETAESSRKGGSLGVFNSVRPSAGILGIILETCFVTRTPKIAMKYWDLLTQKPYNVRPDLANVELYLRICAVNRSSAAATTFLEDVLKKYSIQPRNATLRYAMQACQRNVKSSTSLDHAAKVVDIMSNHMEDPDVMILIQYLQRALYTDDGDKIVHALNHMDKSIHNLRSMVINGSSQASTRAVWAETLTNASTLHQGMIGAIDTLMQRELVPRESYKTWHARRAEMNKFVTTLKKLLDGLPVSVDTQTLQSKGANRHGNLEQRSEKRRVQLTSRDRAASAKQFDALKKFRHGSRPEQDEYGQAALPRRAPFGPGLADSASDLMYS